MLSVTFDQNFRFSAHVETAIVKTIPVLNTLVQMEKSEVEPSSLTL